MDKEQKKEIKKLKKEQKYEDILTLYGTETFRKNVSRKYRKADIDKLYEEGRYEDIYRKYGEKWYNEKIELMKISELERTCGKRSIRAIVANAKFYLKATLFSLGLTTILGTAQAVLPMATTIAISEDKKTENEEEYAEEIIGIQQLAIDGTAQILLPVAETIVRTELQERENEKEYAEEIQDYKEQIENYAKYIQQLNLNEKEAIMKVQEDMWNTIMGYGQPELELEGYMGIALKDNYSKGVCRNMADDTAKRLDAINPEWNARIAIVLSEEIEDSEEQKAKVIQEQINIESRTIDRSEDTDQKIYKGIDRTWKALLYQKLHEKYDIFNSNHAVVLMDSKEDNMTLMIDPTNKKIGIFRNGKIEILNGTGYKNTRKPIQELTYRGIEALQIPAEYLESLLTPTLSDEEIKEKYSNHALNEALESAREKERDYLYQQESKQANQELKEQIEQIVNALKEKHNQIEIPKEDSKSFFKDQLKVEKKIYSYEEMEQVNDEILQQVNTIRTNEEAIRIANQYRKLRYSMEYYEKSKEEQLGKACLPDYKMKNDPCIEITNKLIETNALMIPTEPEEISQEEKLRYKERMAFTYLTTATDVKIEELSITKLSQSGEYGIYAQEQLVSGIKITQRDGQIKIDKMMNEIEKNTNSKGISVTHTEQGILER